MLPLLFERVNYNANQKVVCVGRCIPTAINDLFAKDDTPLNRNEVCLLGDTEDSLLPPPRAPVITSPPLQWP